MRKLVTEDLSLENMIGSLFNGKSKGAYAIESEELSDGGELTSTEIEVLEDDDADPEFLGEESLRHFSDANSMSLSLQSAEEFVWKRRHCKSIENEDDVIVVEKLKGVKLDDDTNLSEEQKRTTETEIVANESIWSKFWEWLKTIFSKIRIGIVTFFKKIQIWLAGDMRKFGDWYESNKDYIKDIKASSVTLKIRLLNVHFNQYESNIKSSIEHAKKITTGIADKLKTTFWEKHSFGMVKVDHTLDVHQLKIDNEIVKKVSPESFREELYGKNTVRAVPAKDFFAKFDIENLLKASNIKTYMKDSQGVIDNASVGIKTTIKAMNITDNDARKAVRLYALGLEQGLNKISTGLIWLTSAHIQLLNTTLRYGNKYLANNVNKSKTERAVSSLVNIAMKK